VVNQIIHNRNNKSSFPIYVLLSKLSDQFISDWNKLIKSLNGQWILHVGKISYDDLHISNDSHFIQLLKTGLDQKLMKNFFQDEATYQRLKTNGKVLITQLQLQLELTLVKQNRANQS
jgi:hypothetical protein